MSIKNIAAALMAAATLGAASSGAEPLGSGLAAYLTFDDAAVSNRIPNGTITGVTLSDSGIASGVRSGEFGHSGFGGYLDVNQGWARLDGSQNLAFENGNDFTICIWMRAEAAPSGDPAFVGNGSWSGTKTPGALLAYYNLGVAANYSFVTNNVADRRRINGTTKTKKWNFYAISHTSDGKFCFYQGNNVDSFITVEDSDPPNSPTFTLVYDAVANRRPFYLGQDGTGAYGSKFVGKLDEFALWTRGLSSSDINSIYQNGRKGHALDSLLKPGISMSDLGAGNIRLSFDGLRTEDYELYVGSGSVDCGADRFAWDYLDRIATIAPTNSTYDYALSDGIKNENRYYRFFLTKDADYQEVEYVQNDGNGSGTGSADNAHFVTSIEPTKDTTVATEVEVVDGTTWCEMFGACNNSAKAFYHLAYLWTEKVWDTEIMKWPAAGGGTLKFGSLTTGTRYAFDYTVRGVTWWNSSEEGVSSVQTLMTDSVAADFPGVAHGLAVFRCEGVNGSRYDRSFQGKMYSLVISTNGVLASDFIPVKNASGTVGFYENGAKTFHPSVSDRPFVGGPAVASRLSVQTETVKAIGASDPLTAYWVGGANGAIDDPESWHCENTYGDAIEAVPQAITDISIANAGQMFSVPANASLDCNSIAITASIALAADCDWQGVDLAKVTGVGTVDLAGHKLYLATSANIGNAINITDLTGGGELHVEVPFGSIVENTGLSLAGAATLVKDGDGTLIASCPNQSNTGGVYVNGGTLKTAAYINTGILGASGSPVKVGSCGTLRIDNGYTGMENHPLELGGGVLYVYNSSVMPGRTVIGNMTLTADSTLRLETVVGVGGDSTCDTELANGTVWNLGGHELTILFETTNTDFFAGKEKTIKPIFMNGIIILPSTVGYWQDWGVNASNHVRYVYGMINTRERADSSAYDFVNNIPAWANFIKEADAPGTMSVYGTYTPSETNLCFSIRMMNGSTINLGNRTTAMPTFLGKDNNGIVRTMTFESGATVNIDLGSRKLANGDKIVSWSAIPEGITFVDPSKRWRFDTDDNGLYVVRGLMLIIK